MILITYTLLLQYLTCILAVHFIFIIFPLYNLITQISLPYFLCFLKMVKFLIYLFTNQISNKCVLLMLVRYTFVHLVQSSACGQKNRTLLVNNEIIVLGFSKKFFLFSLNLLRVAYFTLIGNISMSDIKTTNFFHH